MVWNTLVLALQELRRNAMRSALTILGIVIGVAAVIIMVTIGEGATVQVTEQIASLGTNLLVVRPGQRLGPGQRTSAEPFDLRDSKVIARDISSVAAVAPSSSQAMLAIFGNATGPPGSPGLTINICAYGIGPSRLVDHSPRASCGPGGRSACSVPPCVRNCLAPRLLWGAQSA